MAEIAKFEGFPKRTFTFLKGLSKNNDKAWFDAHRADYEDAWVAPAKSFVVSAGKALKKIAPDVEAQPKVNGSIFRINRDVRFSKDKRPYKDHLDFWFWEGERKGAVSGYFLRIAPEGVGIGVGAHMFDKDRLAAYREAVVDPKAGKALHAAVKAVEKAGFPVKGEHYKKLPRGFDADGPAERYLKHNALWCGEDLKAPPSVHDATFVRWCVDRWKKLAPIHRWLVAELQ